MGWMGGLWCGGSGGVEGGRWGFMGLATEVIFTNLDAVA